MTWHLEVLRIRGGKISWIRLGRFENQYMMNGVPEFALLGVFHRSSKEQEGRPNDLRATWVYIDSLLWVFIAADAFYYLQWNVSDATRLVDY